MVALCKDLDADAAIVAEPTSLRAVIASKGLVRWKIETIGKSAHSAKPHLGVNAIEQMAHVISAIEHDTRRLADEPHPLLGPATCNIGVVRGGVQINLVPASCEIEIDRRMLPGETCDDVLAHYQQLLDSLAAQHPGTTDVDPSEPSSAPESEAAISGDLAQTPISEALLRLRRDAASGVLTVTHRKNRKAFELRNGSPVAASTSGGVEALEEFLARRGRISQEQRRTVKERVGAGKGSSGEILVGLGALSEEKFTAAIREQAEEQLLETFRWTSGAFHYFPDKHLRADVALEIERGQAALMLEGARHWSPHEVVTEALSRSASLYVSTVEELPCELAELDLSSAERVFFEHMYGDRNVQEVLDSGDLDARTLHGLFTAGLLVTLEEPVMLLLDASRVQKAPQPEVVPEVPTLEEPLLDPALDFAEEAQPSTAQLPPPLAASTSFIEPSPLANAAPGPDPEPSPLANAAPGPDPEPTPKPAPEPTPKPTPEPLPPPKPAPEPLPPPEPVPEPPPLAEPLTPAWNAERTLEELTVFCGRSSRDGYLAWRGASAAPFAHHARASA